MEPLMNRKKAKALLNLKHKRVEQEVDQLKIEKADDRHRLAFLYASANRYNIMSYCSASDDAAFFRKVIFHERMALEERKLLGQLAPLIELKGLEHIERFDKRGIVFCSFHVGSFFSPLYLFASQGIDVTACIASNAYTQLKKTIENDISKLSKNGFNRGRIKLLDMGTPTASFQMVRILKEGGNLLLYVDVASGDEDKKKETTTIVNMLSGKLKVKKGGARISYLTKRPIIPLMSQYNSNGIISLRAYLPILPPKLGNEQAFCKRAMEMLFSLLEKRLYKKPEEWEGWLYCHNMVIPKGELESNSVKGIVDLPQYMVNRERFVCYNAKDRFYLFDKETYRFIKIAKEVYFSLFENMGKGGNLTGNLLEGLIENGVLIQVVQ